MSRPLVALALCIAGLTASAQDVRSYIQQWTREVKPLEFPAGMEELGMFSRLSNVLFKPATPPPYAVVVLGHTCGGVGRPHIKERTREFLAAGFAVMALDSFGPRGLQHCRNQASVRSPATVMDAYAALDHLHRFAEVDRNRIFFVGYSWGGVVAPQLASPQPAEVLNARGRYRATVSYYAGCHYHQAPPAPRVDYLLQDTDRPVLMLLAGRDQEFNAGECVSTLEAMKAAGKPVSWHVYRDTHHAWDQSDQRGQETIRTPLGHTNVYLYDAAATADATRRTIEYLNGFR